MQKSLTVHCLWLLRKRGLFKMFFYRYRFLQIYDCKLNLQTAIAGSGSDDFHDPWTKRRKTVQTAVFRLFIRLYLHDIPHIEWRTVCLFQHLLNIRFFVEYLSQNKKIKQDSRRAIVLNVRRLALNILLCWDAGMYVCCYMNKHTVIQSANHAVKRMTVWSFDRSYTHAVICMFTYTVDCRCIQSSSRPIDISAIRTAIRSFGRPNHLMTEHFMPVSTLCRLWRRSGNKRHCLRWTESQNRSVSLPL